MRTRGTWLALVLAMLLAVPPQALAAGRDKRAAAAHFQKASALYADGSYAEALDEFKAGYDAYPLPGFLVNLAQCYRKLDRLDEAAESYQRFLDARPGDAALRAEVDEALADVKRELSARAEAEAQRKREEEQKRQALLRSIAEEQARAQAEEAASRRRPVAAVEPAGAALVEAAPVVVAAPRKRNRWWVWTLVGVGAGVVAAGVTVGVLYGRPQPTEPGSLGLFDGRR